MTQTVLVTGACGHIGKLTVGHLVASGHRVIAVDLESHKAKKVAAGFDHSVTIVWGDICNPDLWTDALVGVDTVIHFAAVIPPTTGRKPNLAVAVNEMATRDLLEQMEASATAKRLIVASSMAIAGAEQSRREPPLRVNTALGDATPTEPAVVEEKPLWANSLERSSRESPSHL